MATDRRLQLVAGFLVALLAGTTASFAFAALDTVPAGVVAALAISAGMALALILGHRMTPPAERAAPERSQFLAVMSHELRTPLNAIVGFSEIMAEEREGPLGNPAYRGYARDIRDSSRHLQALIGDVIEFARVDGAGAKLYEQPVDPGELLDVCVKMCRPEALARGITVIQVNELPHLEVVGDLTRLKQILTNLIANAVKFTGNGGQIDIRLGKTASGELEFRIADNGIGIARHELPRIFQPFVQGDAGISRRFGGIGLGLAIARKLARQHGGDVTIESTPGIGTTARLILPTARLRNVAPGTSAAA